MIMNSGNYLINTISNGTHKFQEFMNPKSNAGFIRGMIKHFGNKPNKNNYEFNKKYPHLGF